MKVQLELTKDVQIKALYVFFLVHTLQIGAGIMTAPRILSDEVNPEAWVSILLAAVYAHFIAWVMIRTLSHYENADLAGIHLDIFGKIGGSFMTLVFTGYLLLVLVSVVLNYIEVVNAFIFPGVPMWVIGLFIMVLAMYGVTGGFRVVTGITFFLFFGTFWLAFTITEPVSRMEWSHLHPLLDAPWKDVLSGAYKTTYSLLGIEILYFIYPYIQNKKNIPRYAYAAITLTILLLLLVTVASIGYFSADQLRHTVWPTLSMFKIIHYTFIERFDLIAVSLWIAVILPNVTLFLWTVSENMRRLKNIQPIYTMLVVTAALLLSTIFIDARKTIIKVSEWASTAGFWLVFVYPLILLVLVSIVSRVRKRRDAK